MDVDAKQESPGIISTKIIDQTKKSGEFDKYQHELANSIIESSEMQKLLEKCKGIIEETLLSTTDANFQKYGIVQIRENVKGEIKKRKLVDNVLNHVLNQHMQLLNPLLSVRIEEMVHAELGIPKEIKQELPDANLELIDMEVSSGGSAGPSTASNTPGRNSPRRHTSFTSHRKLNMPGNRSTASTSHSSVTFGQRKSSMSSIKSQDDQSNKIDVEMFDEEDPSAMLDKFADSISSACSSSLSCNASEDGTKQELEQKSTASTRSSSDKCGSTHSLAKHKTTISGDNVKENKIIQAGTI